MVDKEATGRAAHVACFNGDKYDANQMTIADVIDKEE
jgi:hypothetical protein